MFRTSPLTVLAAATLSFLAAAPALAQGNPSDAEIAHVAVTANAIDVEMGEIARRRAVDERVRAFAGLMITDHTAVNERAAALAGRLGVTPEDNGISRSLRDGSAAAKEALEAASIREFDRAYMDREVEYHRAVLRALDETLIPSTENGELRALLEQARGAIAAHLTHAEELHAALGNRTHTVEIRNFAFSPARLDVAVGETVVWINRDAAPHTATDSLGSWDSAELGPGERWMRIAEAPGHFSYLCAYHPSMTGTITVRAAAADPEGSVRGPAKTWSTP